MLAIMSLVVANAISISVRERRTELAVLKVLGFRPWHVMGLVLGEALLIGFFAGLLGVSLVYFGLGNFKFQVAFFGAFVIPPETLIYGPMLGMAVATAGSLLPALSARNVKVSEVFSRVA
jgi:putative ABC transport system permease protein